MFNSQTGKTHCDICNACGCGVSLERIDGKDICINCKHSQTKFQLQNNRELTVTPEPTIFSKANCGFTLRLIDVWRYKLQCAKDNDKLPAIFLTEEIWNKHMTTLQEALDEAKETGDTCKYYYKLVPIQGLMMSVQNNAGC